MQKLIRHVSQQFSLICFIANFNYFFTWCVGKFEFVWNGSIFTNRVQVIVHANFVKETWSNLMYLLLKSNGQFLSQVSLNWQWGNRKSLYTVTKIWIPGNLWESASKYVWTETFSLTKMYANCIFRISIFLDMPVLSSIALISS